MLLYCATILSCFDSYRQLTDLENYSRNFWPQRPGNVAALSGGHARAEAKGSFGDRVLARGRRFEHY